LKLSLLLDTRDLRASVQSAATLRESSLMALRDASSGEFLELLQGDWAVTGKGMEVYVLRTLAAQRANQRDFENVLYEIQVTAAQWIWSCGNLGELAEWWERGLRCAKRSWHDRRGFGDHVVMRHLLLGAVRPALAADRIMDESDCLTDGARGWAYATAARMYATAGESVHALGALAKAEEYWPKGKGGDPLPSYFSAQVQLRLGHFRNAHETLAGVECTELDQVFIHSTRAASLIGVGSISEAAKEIHQARIVLSSYTKFPHNLAEKMRSYMSVVWIDPVMNSLHAKRCVALPGTYCERD
jgi:hypothetical protein